MSDTHKEITADALIAWLLANKVSPKRVYPSIIVKKVLALAACSPALGVGMRAVASKHVGQKTQLYRWKKDFEDTFGVVAGSWRTIRYLDPRGEPYRTRKRSNNRVGFPDAKAEALRKQGWLTRREVEARLNRSCRTIRNWERIGVLHWERAYLGENQVTVAQRLYNPEDVRRISILLGVEPATGGFSLLKRASLPIAGSAQD